VIKLNCIIRTLLILIAYSCALYPNGYICALGGGFEDYNDWSDEPYGWIVDMCDSSEVLVLSYSDASDWIPDYFKSLGAVSSSNIKINSRELAESQDIYDRIINAGAVFIKGGDQWKYIDFWKGTKTESAIRELYNSGGVIAGTSAGAMILGEIVFSAENGSADPREALINPISNSVKLEDQFLGLIGNVLFDTHFIERGRVGRLISFILNYKHNAGKEIMGVGIDDKTAICIGPDGISEVFGSGAVSIFEFDNKTAANISVSNNKLDYSLENLLCNKLVAGWKYDINNRKLLSVSQNAKAFNSINELNIPASDILFSGGSDLDYNFGIVLPDMLNNLNKDNIVFLHEGIPADKLEAYVNHFESTGYHSISIAVDDNAFTDDSLALLLDAAEVMILSGSSINNFPDLNNSEFPLSAAFQKNLNENVPIIFLGDCSKLIGSYYMANTGSDKYSSYYGEMSYKDGLGVFGDIIIQPNIYSYSDYNENRVSALTWGLMRTGTRIGLYADHYNSFSIDKHRGIISKQSGSFPLFVISTGETTLADSSVYSALNNGKTRQVSAMNNLRYTVANNGEDYSYIDSKLISSLKNEFIDFKHAFSLSQNYPNPFNPATVIQYSIPDVETQHAASLHTKLTLYDILGREITTLVNGYQKPGIYNVTFNASGLSSGIYFYKLSAGNNIVTRKMLFMK